MQVCERVQGPGDRVLSVYCEDFVAEPSRVVDGILGFAGHDAGHHDRGFVRQRWLDLGAAPRLLGNPGRYRCGCSGMMPNAGRWVGAEGARAIDDFALAGASQLSAPAARTSSLCGF